VPSSRTFEAPGLLARLPDIALAGPVDRLRSGFIGGIKERTAKSILEGRFPERVVEKAIERMIPRGPLGRVQLGNLRVYPQADHPHAAQKPEPMRKESES